MSIPQSFRVVWLAKCLLINAEVRTVWRKERENESLLANVLVVHAAKHWCDFKLLIGRERLRKACEWILHAKSVQNYCISLLHMQICYMFIAIVVVATWPLDSLLVISLARWYCAINSVGNLKTLRITLANYFYVDAWHCISSRFNTTKS